MKNTPRKIFIDVLSFLARVAIKKHKIRLLIISGRTGSDLARELIYTVLKDTQNVRRNTSPIWWDLSLPLNILGYEDKQHTSFGWIKIVLSATLAMIVNKSNPQLLILNVESENRSTIKYWSEFVNPEYLVILSYDQVTDISEELIMKTVNNGGKIIIPTKIKNIIPLLKQSKGKNIIDYGASDSTLIIKDLNKDELIVKYKSQEKKFNKKALPAHSSVIAGAMFVIAVNEGLKIEDAFFESLKFTFPSKLLSRIKANLNNKEFNV